MSGEKATISKTEVETALANVALANPYYTERQVSFYVWCRFCDTCFSRQTGALTNNNLEIVLLGCIDYINDHTERLLFLFTINFFSIKSYAEVLSRGNVWNHTDAQQVKWKNIFNDSQYSEVALKHWTGLQFARLIKTPGFFEALSESQRSAFITAACSKGRDFGFQAFQVDERYDGTHLAAWPFDCLLRVAKSAGSDLFARAGSNPLPQVILEHLNEMRSPWITVLVYTYLERDNAPYYQNISIHQALRGFDQSSFFSRVTHYDYRSSDKIVQEVKQYFNEYHHPQGGSVEEQEKRKNAVVFLQGKMMALNQYYDEKPENKGKDHSLEPKMQVLERLLSSLIRSLRSDDVKLELLKEWAVPKTIVTLNQSASFLGKAQESSDTVGVELLRKPGVLAIRQSGM